MASKMLSAVGIRGYAPSHVGRWNDAAMRLLKRAMLWALPQSHNRPHSQDSSTRSSASNAATDTSPSFDEKLLEHLVCPLSKKDLRYDKEKNELVCDEIGVAYPIVNGIPNLVPQDARKMKDPNPLES